MFPLVIILIILVFILALLAMYVYNATQKMEQNALSMVRESFKNEFDALAKIADWKGEHDTMRRDLRRLKDWTKMPGEPKEEDARPGFRRPQSPV